MPVVSTQSYCCTVPKKKAKPPLSKTHPKLAKEADGWELIELRGPLQGDVTYSWEQSIMKMLRANGANLGDETINGKFEGFTEAWSKSTFNIQSIKELMRLSEEFEENKK